ncbi:MAG TPA: hypothetical protein VGP72_31830 [Planctomycetota bacterium]
MDKGIAGAEGNEVAAPVAAMVPQPWTTREYILKALAAAKAEIELLER